LGFTNNRLAVDLLLVLLHDKRTYKRTSAARGLAVIGTQRALAPLIETFENDPVWWVRLVALASIGQLGTRQALEYVSGAPVPEDPAERQAMAEVKALFADVEPEPLAPAAAPHASASTGRDEVISRGAPTRTVGPQ